MFQVMNRVNFTGSLKDFIVSLKHDKRFFFMKTKVSEKGNMRVKMGQ